MSDLRDEAPPHDEAGSETPAAAQPAAAPVSLGEMWALVANLHLERLASMEAFMKIGAPIWRRHERQAQVLKKAADLIAFMADHESEVREFIAARRKGQRR